ncbi:hypothetical protein AB0H73_39690 [Streptomyces olivoreticuli]
MYEMCAASATPGSPNTVWHVISHNTRNTLCGHALHLIRPHSLTAAAILTELHCPACMAVFSTLMHADQR